MLKNNSTHKTNFFYKYAYFIAVAVGVVALTAVIVISSLVGGSEETPIPVDTTVLFAMPLLNANTHKMYSGTELQYNASLNQWEAHKAVSYLVTEDASVFAAYDGVVREIYTNYLEGTVVKIDHGNGLSTTYGSLDKESLAVEVGKTVKKGDMLAKASDSANRETGLGAYLHFTTYENGKKIDPSSYLNAELK